MRAWHRVYVGQIRAGAVPLSDLEGSLGTVCLRQRLWTWLGHRPPVGCWWSLLFPACEMGLIMAPVRTSLQRPQVHFSPRPGGRPEVGTPACCWQKQLLGGAGGALSRNAVAQWTLVLLERGWASGVHCQLWIGRQGFPALPLSVFLAGNLGSEP